MVEGQLNVVGLEPNKLNTKRLTSIQGCHECKDMPVMSDDDYRGLLYEFQANVIYSVTKIIHLLMTKLNLVITSLKDVRESDERIFTTLHFLLLEFTTRSY